MSVRPGGIGRALLLYGVASLAVVAAAAVVLAALYGTPAERRAVLVSAAIALVVQLLAFAIARLLAGSGNGIAGWGLGAAICLAALVVYGFASRALGLPSNVALLSLATFFFLTELIEPPLLNV